MDVLNFLIIIVLIAAKSEIILSQLQPAIVVPKCYRNTYGFCRTFDTASDAYNANFGIINPELKWTKTTTTDCAKRAPNEVKCCFDDCQYFLSATCTGEPVCATSLSQQRCQLFASPCVMKKTSCNAEYLQDWRITNMTACRDLQLNAPPATCTVYLGNEINL